MLKTGVGKYPKVADEWREIDGHPFCHTYFYPAEQYNKTLIEQLADHCRSGWGEIEIHLHHGVSAHETPENTRRTLVEFRDALVRHGFFWDRGLGFAEVCIRPRKLGTGKFRLRTLLRGRTEKMRILSETGRFADLTSAARPSPGPSRKDQFLV